MRIHLKLSLLITFDALFQQFYSSSENLTAEQQRREKLKGFLNADILTASEANSVAATQDRILSFRNKAPAADEAHLNNHKVLYSTGKPKAPLASKTRQVKSQYF